MPSIVLFKRLSDQPLWRDLLTSTSRTSPRPVPSQFTEDAAGLKVNLDCIYALCSKICQGVEMVKKRKSQMKPQTSTASSSKTATQSMWELLNVINWGRASTLPGPWLVFQPPRNWRRAAFFPRRHAGARQSHSLSYESDFSASDHRRSTWHQRHTWAGQALPWQLRHRPANNKSFYFFTVKQAAAGLMQIF